MAGMKAVWFVCAFAMPCLTISVSVPARAETWKSSVQLYQEKSTNPACSQTDLSKLYWDLTLRGNTLSGVSTAGAKCSTTVAADGSVKTTFTSQTAGVGTYPVELSGNVTTREFELFNP